MQGFNLGEGRMTRQAAHAAAIEPLTKSTIAMRLFLEISLVGREIADQGPVDLLSPLLMVKERLIELAQRRAQFVMGKIGKWHWDTCLLRHRLAARELRNLDIRRIRNI